MSGAGYALDLLELAGPRVSDDDFDKISVMAALVEQDFAIATALLHAARKPDRSNEVLMAAIRAISPSATRTSTRS